MTDAGRVGEVQKSDGEMAPAKCIRSPRRAQPSKGERADTRPGGRETGKTWGGGRGPREAEVSPGRHDFRRSSFPNGFALFVCVSCWIGFPSTVKECPPQIFPRAMGFVDRKPQRASVPRVSRSGKTHRTRRRRNPQYPDNREGTDVADSRRGAPSQLPALAGIAAVKPAHCFSICGTSC